MDNYAKNYFDIGKKVVKTENAPEAIGPYSQAVYATGESEKNKCCRGGSSSNESGCGPRYLFVSGQLGIVPSTNEFAAGDNPYHAQTVQAMKNIGEILKAAHGRANFNNIIKTTILLVDMNAFSVVNDAYKQFFDESEGYPARACYQVSALPKGGLVEIEAIAVLSKLSANTTFYL